MGQKFADFDSFREAFWKAVAADENLAKQFAPQNSTRMQKGLVPIAHQSQWLGKGKSYILHHETPIYPNAVDYIFQKEYEGLSVEKIVDKALSYKPFIL
jgi:hypothetical protein